MGATDPPPVTWRKSSRSNGGSDQTSCVEVAGLGDEVALRDSKNPSGPVLTITRAEWLSLIHISEPTRPY